MKPANKQFLEDNMHHWITLRDAEYMKGLNAGERDGMIRVMQEEFIPGYSADLWCPPCVADMVRLLYTKYEAWKAAQPVIIEPEPQQIITNPTVVASKFPSNKNHRR